MAQNDQTHLWVHYNSSREYCQSCGVMRRLDQQNSRCPHYEKRIRDAAELRRNNFGIKGS